MATSSTFAGTAAARGTVTYGYSLAELQTSIADAQDLDKDNAASLLRINQAIMATGQAASTWHGIDWDWLEDTANFQTAKKTVETVANDGVRVTSNIVTITTTAAHGLQKGQVVKVSSTLDSSGDASGVDGIFTIASAPTTTTFTYGFVADNIGAAAAGGGSVNVASYPIRTIDITGAVTATEADQIAPTLRTIRKVYFDNDWPVGLIAYHGMRANYRILSNTATGSPTQYAIHGEPPQIYFWDIPGAVKSIFVDYIKRHPMPAVDADLLIPGEFHWQVYVEGALWMLRSKVTNSASLAQCPPFVEAMSRMKASAKDRYDPSGDIDKFADSQAGTFPHNRRVQILDGSIHFLNDPTL